jgi:hypothetical protein
MQHRLYLIFEFLDIDLYRLMQVSEFGYTLYCKCLPHAGQI